MSWYYSRATGDLYEATGLRKWYADRETDLEKNLPDDQRITWGPFATKAAAEQARTQHPPVATAVKDAIAKPVTDITSAIATGVNQLGQYMVRFLEAAAGIVLLAIALNAILKATTGVDVRAKSTQAAAVVAKVVK